MFTIREILAGTALAVAVNQNIKTYIRYRDQVATNRTLIALNEVAINECMKSEIRNTVLMNKLRDAGITLDASDIEAMKYTPVRKHQ